MDQKMSKGKPVAQQFPELGFTATPMVHPPGRLLGLIVGMPATGKSYLLQSNPKAYIFNLDGSSTTNPNPQACIWPGIGGKGEPIDVSGAKIILTWDAILEKKKQLIEMSNRDEPRPETVVFDSLGAAIHLIKDWVTKKSGKTSWKELDGRRAWDDVYEGLLRFSLDMRQAGYGFFFVCHLVNAKIPLGDDRYTIRPELTITDNFYKRLFPLFELVAAMEAKWITKTKMVQLPGLGGKPGPKKQETVKTKVHFLTVNDESLAGITKCRVKMADSLELPEEDAWSFFESAYVQAETD